MKLALMALAIEISLVRMFSGSWIWAVGIVAIYCFIVYIRKTLSIKKRNRMNEGNGHFFADSYKERENQYADMYSSHKYYAQ